VRARPWPLCVLLAACGLPMPTVSEGMDPRRFSSCQDPEVQRAWDQALVHLQAGRDRDAVPLLRSVVERCPEHVAAHRYYQEAATHVGGDTAAAMAALYRQLPDNSRSPVPAYAKAALLPTDYERKQALDKILARFSDFAWAHLSLARVQRKIGRMRDAVESYQRAVSIDHDLIDAYLELAETLVELGQYEEAVLPYDNYLRGNPNDRSAVLAYAHLLLYRLGRHAAARPLIERLLAGDPGDAVAMMDLAGVEWRAGNREAALANYLRVLEGGEAGAQTDARAALNIGNLHYDAYGDDAATRREHWPKARKAYQFYLRLIRPEDGQDMFEKWCAVPFRMHEIEQFLGPEEKAGDKPGDKAPTPADLK
jgi:tetratricopeptide (TPR) repeat protein